MGLGRKHLGPTKISSPFSPPSFSLLFSPPSSPTKICSKPTIWFKTTRWLEKKKKKKSLIQQNKKNRKEKTQQQTILLMHSWGVVWVSFQVSTQISSNWRDKILVDQGRKYLGPTKISSLSLFHFLYYFLNPSFPPKSTQNPLFDLKQQVEKKKKKPWLDSTKKEKKKHDNNDNVNALLKG